MDNDGSFIHFVSHGILFGKGLALPVVALAFLEVHLCLVSVKRVIRVGISKKGRYAQQYFADSQRGRPVVLKNIETDGAGRIHVGVKYARYEFDFGRFEWVICWEVNGERKETSLVVRSHGTHHMPRPTREVVLRHRYAHSTRRILLIVGEFLEQPPPGRCAEIIAPLHCIALLDDRVHVHLHRRLGRGRRRADFCDSRPSHLLLDEPCEIVSVPDGRGLLRQLLAPVERQQSLALEELHGLRLGVHAESGAPTGLGDGTECVVPRPHRDGVQHDPLQLQSHGHFPRLRSAGVVLPVGEREDAQRAVLGQLRGVRLGERSQQLARLVHGVVQLRGVLVRLDASQPRFKRIEVSRRLVLHCNFLAKRHQAHGVGQLEPHHLIHKCEEQNLTRFLPRLVPVQRRLGPHTRRDVQHDAVQL
mmetsp:Transcript_32278/g.90390  ORF Transcript_32278/g.90390 Transcript_32278/m.90390 type:complete len:418 (+) Transcript_32278:174-1427(+)